MERLTRRQLMTLSDRDLSIVIDNARLWYATIRQFAIRKESSPNPAVAAAATEIRQQINQLSQIWNETDELITGAVEQQEP